MNIILKNFCRYPVLVHVESASWIEIQPYSSRKIEFQQKDLVHVSIRRNVESYVEKRKPLLEKNRFIIVIQTDYSLTNVVENEIFIITREKICISNNTYYDRLFLNSESAICCTQSYVVLGRDRIQQMFNRAWLRHFIFINPIENFLEILFWVCFVGVVFVIWGWKSALISFLLAYSFIRFLEWIGEKIVDRVFKKGFHMDNEKTDFCHCLEREYIANYYSNPNRKPYAGREIELN